MLRISERAIMRTNLDSVGIYLYNTFLVECSVIREFLSNHNIKSKSGILTSIYNNLFAPACISVSLDDTLFYRLAKLLDFTALYLCYIYYGLTAATTLPTHLFHPKETSQMTHTINITE